jgi:deoxycytidylate deaminase
MKMKLAACLVINNEVISVGHNSDKSHPLQKRFAKNSDAIFKHAEVDCIINALRHLDKEDLKKSTLYVYRVKRKRKGDLSWVDGLAEPCLGCKRAIDHFGIKKVIYSTEQPEPFGIMECQP